MTTRVEDWGFSRDESGGLCIADCRAEELAARYGTPLTVFDEAALRRRARNFRTTFEAAYPGPVDVHFALKCNSTPAVVAAVLDEGLAPEVCTTYEWELARRLGARASSILINGPAKDELIELALEAGSGLIVIDGPGELDHLEQRAASRNCPVEVLLRVNPNIVPKGMNRATATASRSGSVFGFDLETGEVLEALRRLKDSRFLRFLGFHTHVGTGIRKADEHAKALEPVIQLVISAHELGLETKILDVGGGFGIPTSRELTTREFLAYQSIGWLPGPPDPDEAATPEDFARSISDSVSRGFRRCGLPLPRLVLEPGRSLVSQAGVLLVRVARIKERPGLDPWAITDGGAGTVAFPLYYEYHEILLARAPHAPANQRYSLVGSCCHSADWLYRRKRMPTLQEGDVLAVCDAGAYFTVQERGFGTPRPPVVFARDGRARIVRRRETFEDMIGRDLHWVQAREDTFSPAGGEEENAPQGSRSPERLCHLQPSDAEAVSALARDAFGDHPFYTEVLGLDAGALAVYWQAFFRFALRDPSVRVFGLRLESGLAAAVAIADDHFPTQRAYLSFLGVLRRRLGFRALVRYLRFAFAYQKFMTRPGPHDGGEVRGLWLMASPTAKGAGYGAELVRQSLQLLREEGRDVVTALVDGRDRRLHGFYQRLGFVECGRGALRGCPALRLEHPLGEVAPCEP